MDWQFGVPATLAFAALVLVVGRRLIEHIAFLRKYSIPEPVVGGLLTKILISLLHTVGSVLLLTPPLQPGLMVAFFATIGLGADARMLARGGLGLVLFTACVVGMLVMQNVIGIGAAWAMGIDPLIGLIAGSVTMSGGHGTGAAWGQRFAETFGLAAAPGIALAAATFGLVMGGLVGGPVARRLIEQLKARGAPLGVSATEARAHDAAESSGAFTPHRLTVTILLIAASVALGSAISRLAENPTFTLPTFVWTLFMGALIRNGLALAKLHEIDGEALSFVGTVSLSLFLAMALMSLRLWELRRLGAVDLSNPRPAGDRRGALHQLDYLSRHGLELRGGGTCGRAMRVRARRDTDGDCQHAGRVRTLRLRAAGVHHRACGRSILDRHCQRHRYQYLCGRHSGAAVALERAGAKAHPYEAQLQSRHGHGVWQTWPDKRPGSNDGEK